MLVVAVAAEILFEGLICAFGLSVAFWVISRSEVKLHVEGFTESAEEMGDKLRAAIGGDVEGNAVLGENMHDEKSC